MRVDGALEAVDLHYRYGRHDVLRGLSFRSDAGRVCGLLGPNGSGKTTLFKCCLHFLKPRQGVIRLMGENMARMSTKDLARVVSYVPQDSRMAFPFTVREMVRMGRTPHLGSFGAGRLSPEDRRIGDEAMERAGIAHLADKVCHRLSGGQRQLVLIARAMAQNAPLMLLDEPTSALDFHNQIEVWNMLRQVAAEGVSVVVCCHDPNHILWYCDEVAVIHQGRCLASGHPAATLSPAVLQTIYGDRCALGTLNEAPIIYPVM